ncbi:MAG: CatB-related O-acetyltransferase [Cyanobacteria bacterium P01_G01_bin.49]
MKQYPNPENPYPLDNYKRLVFLKNIIKNPNIIVGDFTYYDDFDNPQNFEKNVLYHFDFIGDKLFIGKFCAIASDVKFVMNGGNHPLNFFTTYPFTIFGHSWQDKMSVEETSKGDTVIGNDVWLGYSALIMTGIQIGDGAIIATNAVVTKNVEPYTKYLDKNKRYCEVSRGDGSREQGEGLQLTYISSLQFILFMSDHLL